MRSNLPAAPRSLLLALLALLATASYVARSNSSGADISSQAADRFTPEQRAYWAFRKPTHTPLPALKSPERAAWSRGAIDVFIAAKLEAAGRSPSPAADRRTLLRRLSFDLAGLPPAEDELADFIADASPDAYERVADRLLASPRYGERWGRHWLDLARYAETDGFKSDQTRPDAWRYRDYVIAALNADKPYDRFLSEQLAGDEIAPHDPAALVATGFLRHWPYEDNGRDVFAQRQTILDDITNVTAQVCLGLTYGCARCHNHKFDPILQADYFRLQAFFAALVPRDDLPVGSPAAQAEHQQQLTHWQTATAALRKQMDDLEAPVRDKMIHEQVGMFPREVQDVLAKPSAERTVQDQIIADLAGKQLAFDDTAVSGKMKKDVRDRWTALSKQLSTLGVAAPPVAPKAMGVRDIGAAAPEVHIPGHPDAGAILPGFLSILDPRPAAISVASPAPNPADEATAVEPQVSAQTSVALPTTGRRSTLAAWIAAPENPLTARVMVNRLWQHHFGRGIVATPGDFGRQGERPTHPELLDNLAIELSTTQTWHLKALHRQMICSAAYRQSSTLESAPPIAGESSRQSEPPADTSSSDSDDDAQIHLLARMHMQRIEAEILRDAMLAVSGELNLAMSGPSAYPELPKELTERYGWKPSPNVADRNRRSIYLFVKRNMRLPLFDAFDAPDAHEACCRRDETTTAPQALSLLNDAWVLDRARAMAARVQKLAGDDPAAQIDRAVRLAFGRSPQPAEQAEAAEFFAAHRETALVDFCHVLLNANEFLYVD
jgi:hypothetical protein